MGGVTWMVLHGMVGLGGRCWCWMGGSWGGSRWVGCGVDVGSGSLVGFSAAIVYMRAR